MKQLLYESEVLKAYRHELSTADEACLVLALITVSGLDLVEPHVLQLLEGGGKLRVIVGVDMPTDPDAIDRLCVLQRRFKGRCGVKRFQSAKHAILHSKLAIFVSGRGKKRAILGSSNLTNGGLVGNFETNVLVDDAASTRRLSEYFEELYAGARARDITPAWLKCYRESWREIEKLKMAWRKQRQKVRSIKAESRELPSPTRIRAHKFAFTGKIHGWPRDRRLYPLVKKLRGFIAKHFNAMAGTNALIHGDVLGGRKSTRKLQEARQRQIPIITEDEFFQAVENERRIRSR